MTDTTPPRPAATPPRFDRRATQVGWLLLNGSLGAVTFLLRTAVVSTLGPGDGQCCAWIAIPIAAAGIVGWLLPRGAPAASIVFLLLWIVGIDWNPEFAGPTAKSLWPVHLCMAFVPCLGMFAAESVAAVRRLASERERAAASPTDEPPPA